MKLADLVTDEKTGRYSSTKIWMHIGYGILSAVMIRQAQSNAITPDHMLWYGVIVCGNVTLQSFIKWRFRDGNSDASQK